jgi:hypothetical protein
MRIRTYTNQRHVLMRTQINTHMELKQTPQAHTDEHVRAHTRSTTHPVDNVSQADAGHARGVERHHLHLCLCMCACVCVISAGRRMWAHVCVQ